MAVLVAAGIKGRFLRHRLRLPFYQRYIQLAYGRLDERHGHVLRRTAQDALRPCIHQDPAAVHCAQHRAVLRAQCGVAPIHRALGRAGPGCQRHALPRAHGRIKLHGQLRQQKRGVRARVHLIRQAQQVALVGGYLLGAPQDGPRRHTGLGIAFIRLYGKALGIKICIHLLSLPFGRVRLFPRRALRAHTRTAAFPPVPVKTARGHFLVAQQNYPGVPAQGPAGKAKKQPAAIFYKTTPPPGARGVLYYNSTKGQNPHACRKV